MVCLEVVRARGHSNISALHRTTIEITRERELTPRGDCVIGVASDKSPLDFSEEFKKCARRDEAIIVIVLEASGLQDTVLAHGSSKLVLTSSTKIILRKSTYIDPATVAIRASKAAGDLRRDLVEKLKDPDTVLEAKLYCLDLDEVTSIYRGAGGVF